MLDFPNASEPVDDLRELNWLLPAPYIEVWRIESNDIDHYNHVNNTAYVAQIEEVAWAHSNAIGLSIEHYKTLDRAMVIRQHRLSYIQPCHLHDEIACATWIVFCDKKLRLQRQFQFISIKHGKTVFHAHTDFVCTVLSTGKPTRIPPLFAEIYAKHVVQDRATITQGNEQTC
ncbi:acyl-CoA thioesterase [Agaribacter flavus]|uniref:Acyl-CoA thioesterase n=1 Tax=Agaribacter flavus TaxID=1902781 RepID=A0ABV7FMG1_9ALTE